MSNGDEIKRKSHVKRIYQNDDPSSDTWVDVERIDEIVLVSKRQFPWREKRWEFDWGSFNPDGDGVTKKQITEPTNTSNYIEVPVRDVVMVTEGREQQYQGFRHFFTNDESNSTRETHSRRVYHYDIPDSQLDGDGNPPRDPNDYLNALGAKDSARYLEVEIIDKFWTNERQTRDAQGNIIPGNSGIWQEKKWLLDVDGVDPLLQDRDGETDNDGAVINPDAGPQVDPPWRLDPLQNIVNVNFGGLEQGLVSEYPLDAFNNLPNITPPNARAIDSGEVFDGVNTGASGLGKTVMTTGLVCFGKPRDGDSCFIACTDFCPIQNPPINNTIKRGVPDTNPNPDEVSPSGLKWIPVAGGTGLLALTFAGDAFFAVYNDSSDSSGDQPTRIETSYDGITWTSSDAFPPASPSASGGINDCVGGAVAAIEQGTDNQGRKRYLYVSVGGTSEEDPDNFISNAFNLAWATGSESDWSFDSVHGMTTQPGAFPGPISLGTNQQCTVAGGKGMFVAAAINKENVEIDLGFGNVLHQIFMTPAVAISTDGASWTVQGLPGVPQGGEENGDGRAPAVKFIRSSKDGGYFLASSLAFNGENTVSGLFKSSDGFDWSQIDSGAGWFFTISAVSKNLDPATIVRI